MSYKGYDQIPKERFEVIRSRYQQYLDALNDPDMEPVTVFDPLSAKHLQELELIREVSRDLQKKKEDDMRKAAQAKIEEEKKAAEENEAEAIVEGSKKED